MELFLQAATIMTLGMVLVFLFLALVVLCVQTTAKLVQRHEASRADDSSGETGERAAVAIAVAIHEQQLDAAAKR